MKHVLCVAFLVMAALGCKVRSDSNVDSLGQLTGQSNDAERAACSGPFDSKFEEYLSWKVKESDENVLESIEIEEANKEYVRVALSAIPTEFKDYFFANGGRLIYVKDAAFYQEKCGAGNGPQIACAQIKEDPSYSAPYVYINIAPGMPYAQEGDTPEQSIRRQIEQGTLVAFGMGIHQLMSLRDNMIMPRVPAAPNGGDPKFFEDSRTLSWFFLVDLYRTKFKMDQANPGDGTALDFAEITNLLDDHKFILNTDPKVLSIKDGKWVDPTYQQRWAKWVYQIRQDVVKNSTNSPARGAELRELIYAHAFDGYYCSTSGPESSREIMKLGFKNTFIHMEAMVGRQAGDAKSFNAEVVPTKAEDASNYKELPLYASNNLMVAAGRWNFPVISRAAQVLRGAVALTVRGPVALARWVRNGERVTLNRYSYTNGGYATNASRGYTPRGGYVFSRNQQGWVPGQPIRNVGRVISNVANYARPTNGIAGRIYQLRRGGRFFDGRGFRARLTGGRGRGWNP